MKWNESILSQCWFFAQNRKHWEVSLNGLGNGLAPWMREVKIPWLKSFQIVSKGRGMSHQNLMNVPSMIDNNQCLVITASMKQCYKQKGHSTVWSTSLFTFEIQENLTAAWMEYFPCCRSTMFTPYNGTIAETSSHKEKHLPEGPHVSPLTLTCWLSSACSCRLISFAHVQETPACFKAKD